MTEETTSAFVTGWRRAARGSVAMVALVVYFAMLPAASVSQAAAAPVTLGDWLRTIFVTADRELDRSQTGVAAAAPAPPQPVVQTSTEPSAPKEPVVRNRLPDAWLRRESVDPRKKRRPGEPPRLD